MPDVFHSAALASSVRPRPGKTARRFYALAVATVPTRMQSRATNNDMATESLDYWRARAEEARRRSEQVDDSITKALMLETADSYERIAKAYERMAISSFEVAGCGPRKQ